MRSDLAMRRLSLSPARLALPLILVALFHTAPTVGAAPIIANQLRANAHINAITNGARFRTLADAGSDVGCYGNYCGLQASCAPINEIGPEIRSAPVDKLDGACFLHDICYNCANAAAGDAEKCCPDPQLVGLDKAACDRVFLERLKNDDLCGDGPLADRARCESTRVFAVAAFEALLAGRTFEDELTGTGSPSATNNPNATCPAFSCPYVVSSSCFQVCGDDGCGGQCAEAGTTSACPADYSCDKYAHACFRNEANSGGGGDGSLNPVNAAPSRAAALGVAASVATAITLAALLHV